ncbi:MAG TPA: S53 family peptidase [Actinomycetota bacterium]
MSGIVRKVAIAGAVAGLVLAVASVGALAGTKPNSHTKWINWKGLQAHFVSAQPPTTADCEADFGIACYAPFQIQNAYDLNTLYGQGLDGTGQTIAIVDSFGSPTIEADLAQFDSDFGLPAPPNFNIITPAGPIPPFDPNSDMFNWAVETSLDVEWAHSVAPGANILLVETPVSETEGLHGFPDIMRSENYVISNRLASVISQSFAATEKTFSGKGVINGLRGTYVRAKQAGITVLAGSGDAGATGFKHDLTRYYTQQVTQWPASDPLVTGVGGTQLHLDADGNRTAADNVWNDTYNPNVNAVPAPAASGGGESIFFARPSFQRSVADVVGSRRGVPDISMSAAVDGGAITYLGFPGLPPGYYIVGGTSWATPMFAGVVSIADQAAGHSLGWINPALYNLSQKHAAGIVDVTSGNNTVTFTQDNQTFTVQGFDALPGYDLSTGVGTLDAAALVNELAGS